MVVANEVAAISADLIHFYCILDCTKLRQSRQSLHDE